MPRYTNWLDFVAGTLAALALCTSGNAYPSPVEIRQKLESAYSALDRSDGAVEVQWEMFTPAALQPPPSSEIGASALTLLDPVTGKVLFAQWRYRATFAGADLYRIEKNDTEKTLGDEKARWSVRVRSGDFNGEAGTLKAKRAYVSKARPYSPETDDLFDHEDGQCPSVVAHRLVRLLESVAEDHIKYNEGKVDVEAPGGPISFWIDLENGTLLGARYRAKRSPKDILIKYEGELTKGLYPAPHPALSRLYTLEPGESPGSKSLVSRFDSAVFRQHPDAARWSWTSIAPIAIDTNTNQVITADGTTDQKQTRSMQSQQKSEPARWEEPPEKGEKLGRAAEKSNPWQRWGLAFGLTTIIVAGAIYFRSRLTRS